MLEHQKMVLKGISFDKTLFKKELIKSLSWLSKEEQTKLLTWVKENFSYKYADVIIDVFYSNFEIAS
jgi:hypothetical protein